MSAADVRPKGLRRLLARLRRGRGGSAAVEFALVALPFLALTFGIVALGMIYLITTTLSNAATDAARQIRTCQLQKASATASRFTTTVCNEMSWLGTNCAANLSVDVRTFAEFQDADIADPIANNQLTKTSLVFNMGNAGDIVLVRTYYPWTLAAPLLDGSVVRLSNNQTLISAVTTFRNEPCT